MYRTSLSLLFYHWISLSRRGEADLDDTLAEVFRGLIAGHTAKLAGVALRKFLTILAEVGRRPVIPVVRLPAR
jgi:hypothetical protein